MNKKQLSVITCFILLTFINGFCQDGIIGKINYEDSIIGKIDSITTFNHHQDSKFAYAIDYDPIMPEGMYALYRVDTIKGELRIATLYTYQKKIKKLTNYYFYNRKLIKVTESRVPLKNQVSDKLDNIDRTYYYYKDTLRYFINNTKEDIDYKTDLQNAEIILKGFHNKLASGKLNFKNS